MLISRAILQLGRDLEDFEGIEKACSWKSVEDEETTNTSDKHPSRHWIADFEPFNSHYASLQAIFSVSYRVNSQNAGSEDFYFESCQSIIFKVWLDYGEPWATRILETSSSENSRTQRYHRLGPQQEIALWEVKCCSKLPYVSFSASWNMRLS